MSMERLHQFIKINESIANAMMKKYDSNLKLESLTPIHDGMSTSNYVIRANGKKYLLKIYTDSPNGPDHIEHTMYNYLYRNIPVPSLMYFGQTNSSKSYRFAIIEYIDGQTLNEYILNHKRYPLELMPQIAGALAFIHNKRYESRGLLNSSLQIQKSFHSIKDQIEILISDKAGCHLSDSLRDELHDFVKKRDDIFESIESSYVLSHGDFSYSNILVDHSKRVFLIDFEYSLATNIFHDIGHFFRRKSDEVEKLINKKVYESFFEEYNAISNNPLPNNWIQLAKTADIPALLALINTECPPEEWIMDIVQDINTYFSKYLA